jgi:PHD/YefM family antitoxin component YafN of YafNO toxin-antitoxin module
MFAVIGPSAVIATVSELKTKMKETLMAAERSPVYLVRDGQAVAGIISMDMMAVLQEALEDRRIAQIASGRLDAIQGGEDALIDEDAFWAKAGDRSVTPAKPKPTRKSVKR